MYAPGGVACAPGSTGQNDALDSALGGSPRWVRILPSAGRSQWNASRANSGTVVAAPGAGFSHSWVLRNIRGTQAWGGGYRLVFKGGNQMGAPASVTVPATAAGSATTLVDLLHCAIHRRPLYQ